MNRFDSYALRGYLRAGVSSHTDKRDTRWARSPETLVKSTPPAQAASQIITISASAFASGKPTFAATIMTATAG
jgi:hypothetical protein